MHLLHKLIELPLFEFKFATLGLARLLLHLGLEGQPALPQEFLSRRHTHADQGVANLFKRNFLNVLVGIDDLVFYVRRSMDRDKARTGYILNRREAESRVIARVEYRLFRSCCCCRLLLLSFADSSLLATAIAVAIVVCCWLAPLPVGSARQPSDRNRRRRSPRRGSRSFPDAAGRPTPCLTQSM